MPEFLTNNLPAIALVLAGLCLVAMVVMQAMQISSLRHRVDQLTGGAGEGNLEDVLIQHLESVHAMGQDLDELIARTAVLESSARHHYAHQGLVRFNPFPDTGGNQSFALALLDESESGFIVSSLHSRTGTRIYAKAIVNGKTDTTLSAEETQAIEEARAPRTARTTQGPARSRGAAQRDAARATAVTAPRSAASAQVGVAAPAAPVAPAVEEARAKTPTTPSRSAARDVAAPAVDEPSLEPEAEPEAEAEAVLESANRPTYGKGQSKGEVVSLPDDDGEGEKTGPRPGRRAGAQSTPRAD